MDFRMTSLEILNRDTSKSHDKTLNTETGDAYEKKIRGWGDLTDLNSLLCLINLTKRKFMV